MTRIYIIYNRKMLNPSEFYWNADSFNYGFWSIDAAFCMNLILGIFGVN